MLKGFTLTMWVGFGGFLGSVMRYWLTYGTQKLLGVTFPYGTLVENLMGCYLIGLFGTIAEERIFLSPSLRQFLFIGILGGFTTFSSFSYEALELFKERSFLLGSLYIGGHYVFCLLFAWLGYITVLRLL
ncbi:MAG: fluoride efflux transporter CrcB [Candidatus Brocadiales bacterium]